MAVVIETTLGDITVDLYIQQRPQTCRNFLKLCKIKYYNYNLFHSIRSGFIAQTGDPTGEGSGGESIWGVLEGPKKRFFSGEKMPKIRHSEVGLLSMVCSENMMVGSQFFFTLAADLDSLDGTHCVIGEVTEGHEVLTKLNEVICDEAHRPYRDVRITHTVIIEDPFVDPPGFRAPSRSPSPNPERLKGGRIGPDEDIDETEGKSAAEVQELIEEKEAKARATILEIVGDLPDADIAPPENVLFVCKLNPVTTDDDLEIIFSRFGKIVSCEVIRDKKTDNSLQYAFIEFDNKKSCEDAYFKMDNVLIDDRRIHVDFSQSVSKMRYLGKGRGVQYLTNDTFDSSIDKKGLFRQSPTCDYEKRTSRLRDQKHKTKYDSHNSYQKIKNIRDHTNEYDQHSHKLRRNRSRSRSKRDKSREGNRHSEKSKKRKENYDLIKRDSRYPKDYHKSSSSRNGRRERNSTLGSDKTQDESPIIEKKSLKDKEESMQKYLSHSRDRKSSRSDSLNKNVADNQDKHNVHEHISDHKMSNNNHNSEYIINDQETKFTSYREKDSEPKTPSPIVETKKIKSFKKVSKETKKITKSVKKQRKVSTSSSSDSSSESSSSSDSSSSSSDSDKRKKRRKRKSSSSSSTSSSTSSETSSDSTSSSDSEDHSRKRKKKVQARKPKKKSKK